ncbi:MAG: diphthamide biosynthesis enzyme Dph2 [Candidatus Methanomethylicaceae archaeon]|nr:diphthamide biosynthesis enzyme Dph2 [Candidatus Verstraetearchaeota archaeon]
MKIPYDFEIEKILKELKNVKKVFIQAPDGLKQYLNILNEFKDITFFISTDPCYGGCYLLDDIAKKINCDLIIHFGHEKFIEKEEVPTIYIKCTYRDFSNELIKKLLNFIKENKFSNISIFTNAQHIDALEEFISKIKDYGINVINGGLILGCKIDKVKEISNFVDALFYLGGGDFHALGMALEIEKPVYIIDPFKNEIRDISILKKKVLAKKWWAIHEAKNAKVIGIVIVVRKGQFNINLAMKLKLEFEELGKKVILLIAEEVNWERLAPFTFIDAFIITGCPRIAIDNRDSFYKPVLNLEEALELLKVIKNDKIKNRT